jgi:hypothetical protein
MSMKRGIRKPREWATLSHVLYQSPSQYSLGVPVQHAGGALSVPRLYHLCQLGGRRARPCVVPCLVPCLAGGPVVGGRDFSCMFWRFLIMHDLGVELIPFMTRFR